MRGIPQISVDVWLLEGVVPVSELLKSIFVRWLEVCEGLEEVDLGGPVRDKNWSRNDNLLQRIRACSRCHW